ICDPQPASFILAGWRSAAGDAGKLPPRVHLGRFDEAVAAAKNAIHRNQAYVPAHRCLAAALALLGRDAEARIAVNQALEIEPDFRLSELKARHLRNPIVID